MKVFIYYSQEAVVYEKNQTSSVVYVGLDLYHMCDNYNKEHLKKT